MNPITTRTCKGLCGESKAIGDFPWKNQKQGLHHHICKACQRENSKKHYQAHQEKYLDASKERYTTYLTENRQKLETVISARGCDRCQTTDAAVLCLVSKGAKAKKLALSRVLSKSWESVEVTISASRVVCENCCRKAGIE